MASNFFEDIPQLRRKVAEMVEPSKRKFPFLKSLNLSFLELIFGLILTKYFILGGYEEKSDEHFFIFPMGSEFKLKSNKLATPLSF